MTSGGLCTDTQSRAAAGGQRMAAIDLNPVIVMPRCQSGFAVDAVIAIAADPAASFSIPASGTAV